MLSSSDLRNSVPPDVVIQVLERIGEVLDPDRGPDPMVMEVWTSTHLPGRDQPFPRSLIHWGLLEGIGRVCKYRTPCHRFEIRRLSFLRKTGRSPEFARETVLVQNTRMFSSFCYHCL